MPRTAVPAADDTELLGRGLRLCAMLRDWPDAVLAQIAAGAHLHRYERRTQVLAEDRQQRDLLVIVSGRLEVSGVNAMGDKFVLTLLGPGEIVGLVRLLPHDVELVYDYHAHQDTVLVHLPAERLHAVLDAHPRLWKDVALLAVSRQQGSIEQLQRRAFGRIDQGLAEALLRLMHWSGQPGEDAPEVSLQVSQADLAAMVSVSRQTINKEIRLLSQRGILTAHYGQLTIHDMPALRQLARTGVAGGRPRPRVPPA